MLSHSLCLCLSVRVRDSGAQHLVPGETVELSQFQWRRPQRLRPGLPLLYFEHGCCCTNCRKPRAATGLQAAAAERRGTSGPAAALSNALGASRHGATSPAKLMKSPKVEKRLEMAQEAGPKVCIKMLSRAHAGATPRENRTSGRLRKCGPLSCLFHPKEWRPEAAASPSGPQLRSQGPGFMCETQGICQSAVDEFLLNSPACHSAFLDR